jgi:putative permease
MFIWIGAETFPKAKEYLFLITDHWPEYYDGLVSFFDKIFSAAELVQYQPAIANLKLEMQQYLNQKAHILASIVGEIASRRYVITDFFSFFIIMPISFFYFLRDWNTLSEFVCGAVPNRHRRILIETSMIIRRTFGNFFQGQFYVVAILSAYYVLLLLAIGVDKYLFLGVISGFSSFVPFIGALFSLFLVILVSLPMLTMVKVYVILAIYMVGQFFEGYVLTPRFVGKKTGLHPLWILFSFFAGIELLGVIGVLVAIPLAAVARNLIGFTLSRFKASQAYKQ